MSKQKAKNISILSVQIVIQWCTYLRIPWLVYANMVTYIYIYIYTHRESLVRNHEPRAKALGNYTK